jgi:hypothetical protein
MRSTDLKTWEDVTSKISFPRGARHGTVLEVPIDVVNRLQNSAGAQIGF